MNRVLVQSVYYPVPLNSLILPVSPCSQSMALRAITGAITVIVRIAKLKIVLAYFGPYHFLIHYVMHCYLITEHDFGCNTISVVPVVIYQ